MLPDERARNQILGSLTSHRHPVAPDCGPLSLNGPRLRRR